MEERRRRGRDACKGREGRREREEMALSTEVDKKESIEEEEPM